MWLDVNYLTRLPVFDIVLLFRWTLDGLILFWAVKRSYSGERKNSPKCIAPLENINGLFGIPGLDLCSQDIEELSQFTGLWLVKAYLLWVIVSFIWVTELITMVSHLFGLIRSVWKLITKNINHPDKDKVLNVYVTMTTSILLNSLQMFFCSQLTALSLLIQMRCVDEQRFDNGIQIVINQFCWTALSYHLWTCFARQTFTCFNLIEY
jgi:hypothetical protein